MHRIILHWLIQTWHRYCTQTQVTFHVICCITRAKIKDLITFKLWEWCKLLFCIYSKSVAYYGDNISYLLDVGDTILLWFLAAGVARTGKWASSFLVPSTSSFALSGIRLSQLSIMSFLISWHQIFFWSNVFAFKHNVSMTNKYFIYHCRHR